MKILLKGNVVDGFEVIAQGTDEKIREGIEINKHIKYLLYIFDTSDLIPVPLLR